MKCKKITMPAPKYRPKHGAAYALSAALVILAVLLLAAGCATQPKQAEQIRPVWPPPPLTARIEFVRSIASEEDVKKDTTFSQKVLDWLSGVQAPPNRIVQPMGLAIAEDGERLYVSNFAERAVFVFDFAKKKFLSTTPWVRAAASAFSPATKGITTRRSTRKPRAPKTSKHNAKFNGTQRFRL